MVNLIKKLKNFYMIEKLAFKLKKTNKNIMIEGFVNLLKKEKIDFHKKCIIFDIGSRDCLQSIELTKQFPNAKIYAFECNPHMISHCQNNIKNYPNITFIQKAIHNFDGRCSFFPIDPDKTANNYNPGASSLFLQESPEYPEEYIQCEIEVESARLDTLMKEYTIPRVDIIWMDLQGAELLALQSLGHHLMNVQYLHTEICLRPIYKEQHTYNHIHPYLELYGFKTLYPKNIDELIQNQWWFADFIYKNNLKCNENIVNGREFPFNYLIHASKLLEQYTEAKTILEIGSIRSLMPHKDTNPVKSCPACNDGHSTYVFNDYTDAKIFSVDCNKQSKQIIDNDDRLDKSRITAITSDALHYLKTHKFDNQIDLLFLDAWDVYDNPKISATKHLQAYKLAKSHLAHNCIILIDDTDICDGGKGRLVIPQAIKDGFKILCNGRQTLLIRNDFDLLPETCTS